MPIEIKELSIKINAGGKDENASDTASTVKPKVNKQAIINECLEQVSELLANKKER